ncbi:NAD(P)-dependent oxidoreductase [Massilia litorea]|uniref:NAD(P)-dependent oxidoreductase n=1 Tax=Massilia litorea TaxID=2769491 RepID=A0A7L9U4G6_9BURK|nr:NAD(P)-dependent oxidoreductase [Massilia litorea]
MPNLFVQSTNVNEAPPRRALVTGASGYVGSHLARRLLAAGWKVHVLLRAGSSFPAPAPALTVHRFEGATEDLVRIVQQAAPDVVFHLAAVFVAEHRPQDVAPLVQANLLFATQLAEAMRVAGVRKLVNTGTAWQHYGDRDYDPVNLYAATKQAFEAILAYYVNAHAFRVATLVLFDTYGPGDVRPKLMTALWRAARSGERLAMSSGRQLLDLVYVDDVVDAYIAAADALRTAAPGQLHYRVSSGAPLRLTELVAAFEAVAGLPIAADWGARPDRPREMLLPWTGGAPPPGWQPRIALADGIRRSAPPADA